MNLFPLLIWLVAEPTADAGLVEGWLKVSQQHAGDYVIALRDPPSEPFRRLPQAVFRHSQPVRGDDIGAVYLWVDRNDRPAVLGTTFAYTLEGDLRAVVHEMHSLADGPLLVRFRRAPSPWQPAEPGLTWHRIPAASAVDTEAAGRQRQIRTLVRRFSAASTDHDGGRWELRLVPKALHQFDHPTTDGLRCGQLSVFCQGTDPELVLLLEAQMVDGSPVWHYAAAPFTDYALSLRLDDKEVWTAPVRSTGRRLPHWAETVTKERLVESDLPKAE